MKGCPHCKAELDGRTKVHGEGEGPEAGDFSFCFECGHWSVFDDSINMRPPTADELREIATSPILNKIRPEWDKLRKLYQ